MPPSSLPKCQVCLVGSGGVGTIASLVLTKSGSANVTSVLRSKYDYIAEHGWDIESVDHGKLEGWKPYRTVQSVTDAATDGAGKHIVYDFVVVCTKQLPNHISVANTIQAVVTPAHTTIVMIQNGMGIEEEIIQTWPSNAVVSSVSHIGSSIQEPNLVVQTGKDVSKMGPHYHDGTEDSRCRERALQFVDMYVAGGASVCELVEDIQVARWEKLLWNGTFNTVCALSGMDVGQVQRSQGRESMLVPMMWEIWRVAKAAGHPMKESIVGWMAYRLPDDCNYRPSMLLDLEKGRPMELEVILGYVIAKARELGVGVPHLTAVYKLLKMQEWRMEQNVH